MHVHEHQSATTETVFTPEYDMWAVLGVEESQARLTDTSLRPFDDSNDVLLRSRLQSGNRLLRQNPAAKALIEEALLDDTSESIVTTADLLEEARAYGQPQNETPIGALLSYVTLTKTITEMGDTTSTDRAALLNWSLGMRLVEAVPSGQVTDYWMTCEFITNRLSDISTYGKELAPRLSIVSSWLRTKARAVAYVDTLPGPDVETYSDEVVTRDSELVAESFGRIRQNQHYGLKLAGKKHQMGGSIILGQPNDETQSDRVVVEIIHSKQQNLRRLKPYPLKVEGKVAAYDYTGTAPLNIMYMDAAGELYTNPSCTSSLLAMCRQQGKYGAYRRLQAGLLADYYDMTRPAEVVRRTAALISDAEVVGGVASSSPADHMDMLRRLVLPRIQVEEANEELIVDIDAEEDSVAGNSVRLHDVTWHRRRLPEGWSPSPQARAMALEAGITLGPNETFVKEHKRGSAKLGMVIGHVVASSVSEIDRT